MQTVIFDSVQAIDTSDALSGNTTWDLSSTTSSKAIKLSMIRLGNDDFGEEVVLRPGSRYAILKVTNGTMTARKGVWSWTAQEIN